MIFTHTYFNYYSPGSATLAILTHNAKKAWVETKINIKKNISRRKNNIVLSTGKS